MQGPTIYDAAEWSSGAVTNYDVSAQTLFVDVKNAKYVSIRCDVSMTVRFNSTSAPAITVNANTAFEVWHDVHHIYITTTGTTAVKIFISQP